MLKRIATAVVRSLIVLIAFSLIFSAASPGFADIIKGSLIDLYDHASPRAQASVIDNLADACQTTGEKSQGVIQGQQLCDNQTLRENLERQCDRYERGIQLGATEEDADLEQTCAALEEGKLDEFCAQLEQAPFVPDFSGMQKTCEGYMQGDIADKQLFGAFISSMFAKQDFQISALPLLQELPALERLTTTAAILIGIVLILLAALYLLSGSTHQFLRQASGVLISLGLLLLIPYAVSSAYLSVGDVNTSPFLRMIASEEEPSIQPAHIASILLLVLKNFYNTTLLMVSIACLVLGIGGKITARGMESEPPAKKPNRPHIHRSKKGCSRPHKFI